MNKNPNYKSFFLLFAVQLSCLSSFAQETKEIDGVTFPVFQSTDSSHSNFIAPGLGASYRNRGPFSTSILQQAGNYRVLSQFDNSIVGKLQVDSTGIHAWAGNSYLSLKSEKAEINFRETWFNGEWIRVPVRATYPTSSDAIPPAGSIFYTSQTKSLLKSDGENITPSYWEYADGKEINPYVLETSWPKKYGIEKMPVIRLRHPLNVTSINLGSESRSRDFSIAPYEYGMAIDYNGVVECWVGEWSIHRGHNYRTNIERNNNIGWGGVLWVGDDEDMGGLRATARNGSDAYYSEVSSEKFSDASHGDLRLRVVDEVDKISFVQGKRGSKNITLDIEKNLDTTFLSAGINNALGFKTAGLQRMTISNDGKVGINSSLPSSMLDLEGVNGYQQLRLRTKYTPTTTADTNGEVGDVSWDNNFIYIKTEQGWKRTSLESF